jgi:hypothetical protein
MMPAIKISIISATDDIISALADTGLIAQPRLICLCHFVNLRWHYCQFFRQLSRLFICLSLTAFFTLLRLTTYDTLIAIVSRYISQSFSFQPTFISAFFISDYHFQSHTEITLLIDARADTLSFAILLAAISPYSISG